MSAGHQVMSLHEQYAIYQSYENHTDRNLDWQLNTPKEATKKFPIKTTHNALKKTWSSLFIRSIS